MAEQSLLLLFHNLPLALSCRKASQGSLYLHVHPGVNRNQFGTTSIGLTECVLGCLLGNVGAIDADNDRAVLGFVGNQVVLADNNNRARCVGNNSGGNGTHDHAREPAQTARAHNHHGCLLRQVEQHVNRTALFNLVADIYRRCEVEGNLLGLVNLLQGLGLKIVVKLLRRNHALCVEELRHGVAADQTERLTALHCGVSGPLDGGLGCLRAIDRAHNDVLPWH